MHIAAQSSIITGGIGGRRGSSSPMFAYRSVLALSGRQCDRRDAKKIMGHSVPRHKESTTEKHVLFDLDSSIAASIESRTPRDRIFRFSSVSLTG